MLFLVGQMIMKRLHHSFLNSSGAVESEFIPVGLGFKILDEEVKRLALNVVNFAIPPRVFIAGRFLFNATGDGNRLNLLGKGESAGLLVKKQRYVPFLS